MSPRPSFEGLAVHLQGGRATIYRWAAEHEEFRDILAALLSAQASQLIQNGLVSNYNPTITKLMLTKHGYRDKQEVDHTSKGERIEGHREGRQAQDYRQKDEVPSIGDGGMTEIKCLRQGLPLRRIQ